MKKNKFKNETSSYGENCERNHNSTLNESTESQLNNTDYEIGSEFAEGSKIDEKAEKKEYQQAMKQNYSLESDA